MSQMREVTGFWAGWGFPDLGANSLGFGSLNTRLGLQLPELEIWLFRKLGDFGIPAYLFEPAEKTDFGMWYSFVSL